MSRKTEVNDLPALISAVLSTGRKGTIGVYFPCQVRADGTWEPEQHFILSLLSPMKTFPMVIPAHIRERIAKLIRVERKDGNPSSLSIIAREAMTLYAIEQKRNPFPVDIPPMDKQGKSANIKVPPSVADSMESLATREAKTVQDVITKSDIARAAIVWFLDQVEAEQ